MDDTKASVIFTALRSLDGVDDKMLTRPEVGYLPSVLEDGELPEFIVHSTASDILVATNRRVLRVGKSVFGSSFKIDSFAYDDITSVEPATSILGGNVTIHTHRKNKLYPTDKSRTRAFALHVNGKIQSVELTATEESASTPPGQKSDDQKSAIQAENDPSSSDGQQRQDPRVARINEQISKLDNASRLFGRREIMELPNILWDSEQILDIVQGSYNTGLGILVSTDRRLIFVDKGMIYGLRVEDFPNDKITSIQYETKLVFGTITIFASGNKAVVENVDKNQARAFAEGVRARLSSGSAPATPAVSGDHTEDDMVGQLEKLATLKEKGILTEEEFAAKKRQLLGI